jgi:hypothetical protein
VQLIILWSTAAPTDRVKVKVKVTFCPTVSRPVCLGVRHPSGTGDQFFFLLEIFFRQLRVCYSVAPSLTRGRVCNLLLLLVLASAIPLGSAVSEERSSLFFVSLLSVSVSTYVHYLCLTRPSLWSSCQSSWLQIRRPGFDSRHYKKKSSGSGTESTQPREYNWGATW